MSDDTETHWEFDEVGDNEPMTDKELENKKKYCDLCSGCDNETAWDTTADIKFYDHGAWHYYCGKCANNNDYPEANKKNWVLINNNEELENKKGCKNE